MYSYHSRSGRILDLLSRTRPSAVAQLCGCSEKGGTCGTLMLYQSCAGTFAVVSLGGIPDEHCFKPYNMILKNTCEPEKTRTVAEFFVGENDAWNAFLTHGFSADEAVGNKIMIATADSSPENIACGEVRRNIGFYG